jgi:flagellar biosynthesis GTPase FlhF
MLSRMNAKLAADHNKQAAQARFKNQIVEMLYATLLEQGVLDYVAEAMLEGLDVEAGPDGEKAGESPDAGLLVRMVYTKIISIIGKPNVAFENRSVSASEIVSDQPESEPDDPDGSKAQNENEAGATKPAGKVRKKKSAKPKKPFVAAFIGPTGVGKTTTIAKLSADFILNKNARVSLISADTYRIAAVEQLRTYADILDIDLGVVYNPEDMREQLSAASGVDVVLIDTAGRSHRHGENMAELKALLESAEICHKYLVLSLTTKFEDMVEIVETFSDISDFNIIFTKLDETKTVGSVLNLCYHTGKTVSYITFGQNVPNDIRVLQPEEIARLILCGTSSVLT